MYLEHTLYAVATAIASLWQKGRESWVLKALFLALGAFDKEQHAPPPLLVE